jgi:hypothetical protein
MSSLRLLPLAAIACLCIQCKSKDARLEAAGTGPLAEASVPDDWARFLAGLPGGRSSRFAAARQTPAWRQHQAEMDRMFAPFTTSRHGVIGGWQGGALGGLGSGPVFYPFGGPDVLYADALFPGAADFVLVGLETASGLPAPETVTGGDLAGHLANLRASLRSVTGIGFFITKDMRAGLNATSLQGALPPILVILARTGHRVQSVELVSLGPDGALLPRGAGSAPGIRIRVDGGGKEFRYFQENLGNENLAGNPRLLRHLSRGGRPVTLLKSASYLLHQERFSFLRGAILDLSRAVVTDPSGMPFAAVAGPGWDVTLYGSYDGPIPMFQEHPQPDLAEAYRSGGYPVKPLPFGVGYTGKSLLVARKR